MTTPARPSATYHAELAWLGGDSASTDVLIEITEGVITAVRPGTSAPREATRLHGLTLPGLVNSHSHVFHRAIRGRSQAGTADFWAWRELMYAVASRIDPDSLHALARATYAEMALSGITCVGEFHYLHHDRAGRRYADTDPLGDAIVRGAQDAGVRLTLLDTCYLQGDVDGTPLQGVQRRFDDDSWESWASRVDARSDQPMLRTGAAIHSVRAVPRKAMRPIAKYAASRALPLHVHLSEQPAENESCQRVFGRSPAQVLDAEGVLGPRTTAVHATHLTGGDIALLGDSRTSVCLCCTTERDLADGVGPAPRLAAAGSALCVGSDAHMAIDLWEEGRAIELDERLVTGRRGHLGVRDLLFAMTRSGAESLGWDSGRIAEGSLGDLVTVALDSPRTAGARNGDPLAHTVFAATAADVTTVVVDGRVVVDGGRHTAVEHVGRSLESAITTVLSDA